MSITGIKPGETNAEEKTIYFSVYDLNGSVTDDEGLAAAAPWAVATFAPGAADFKVGYDKVASSNYAGVLAYRKNGEWAYTFADAEVAAALRGGGVDAKSVYLEFAKANYRSFVIRVPLRYDLQNIKDSTITAASIAANAIGASQIAADAIGASELAADAVTEIQGGLATTAALAVVAGYVDTEVATIQTNVAALLVQVARVQGLLQENSLIDGGDGVLTGPTYSAKKMLTSARVRVFASAADLALATAGNPDDADGEIYRYTITGEDPGSGLMKSYSISRGL